MLFSISFLFWRILQKSNLFRSWLSHLNCIANCQDKASPDKDSPEGPLEWFVGDREAVIGNYQYSWHNRLASVAHLLIRQWVFVHCGYAQPGGTKVGPISTSCQHILRQVPTNPIFTDGKYAHDPFPMAEKPLAQWKVELMSYDNEEDTGPSYPSFVYEAEGEMTALQDGFGGLSPPILRGTVVASMEVSEHASTEVSLPLSWVGLRSQPLTDFLDIAQVPVSPVYQELTPTDFALVYGNTRTKINIALELARQEMEGWQHLP